MLRDALNGRGSLQLTKEKGLAFLQGLIFIGSSTWARTRDLRINSPALYRLSYRGIYSVVIET